MSSPAYASAPSARAVAAALMSGHRWRSGSYRLAGAISASSAPPRSSRSVARSLSTTPVSAWRGPGRPPVDHRRAEPGFGGHFPEGLRAPLGAAGDRRPRQADKVGRASERAAERRRPGDRDAALHAGDPARLEPLHAVHVGRLTGRDRRPDPRRIAGVALARLEARPRPRTVAVNAGRPPLAASSSKIRASKPSMAITRRRRPGDTTVSASRVGAASSRRAGRPREQERGAHRRRARRRRWSCAMTDCVPMSRSDMPPAPALLPPAPGSRQTRRQ